jgi:two-component system phosphate regulon sensor histidine kinase PhoR
VLRKIESKFALQVEEKNARLEIHLDAQRDGVAGHPVHFVNMLSNLVDNALKYCREDVVPAISVSTHNEKNWIVVVVKDNGIGMTKDTMSKIFDKFYRAHTGDVHNVKGFGLGLNYTKKMVEAHHGTIEVSSTLNAGSTFTVKLPLR